VFSRLFDRWLMFRASLRSRYDALESLEDRRLREKHQAEWEIEKRQGEIEVLNAKLVFMAEALEMERAWVSKMTAQFSVDQALAEARGR